MAKRTAKQIAATKALVKLNKERAGESSKSKKSKGSKSKSSTASLVGRVSNLEKRVAKHSTQIGRVEKVLSGVTGYLMDTISSGVLPPVKG